MSVLGFKVKNKYLEQGLCMHTTCMHMRTHMHLLHTTHHHSIFHPIKFSLSDICTYFTNTLQGLW